MELASDMIDEPDDAGEFDPAVEVVIRPKRRLMRRYLCIGRILDLHDPFLTIPNDLDPRVALPRRRACPSNSYLSSFSSQRGWTCCRMIATRPITMPACPIPYRNPVASRCGAAEIYPLMN